ncbi:MAG TPA: ATP-binding protein, partial [Polyangiaceae bacterium]|nr:ATP-binding protein [Polyangiaceae bacterium]
IWTEPWEATLVNRELETRSKPHQLQKLESLALLAGGIAHDFNNLLVGILGNVGLLLLDTPEGSPLLPGLEDIQSAALRAADLTKQMLTYSGRGRFVAQNTDLNRWVEEVVKLFSSALAQNCSLDLRLGPAPLFVEADPSQLRQLILNLLTNAADALADRAGRITVATGHLHADHKYLETCFADDTVLTEGEYAFIEVTDTGPGISPGMVDRIFDPFFTTKFQGRGLGLPAVLGILRGHGGAIHVKSEPGKGAAFRALLPVVAPRAEKPSIPSSERGLSFVGTGCILVADDEETVRTISERVLNQAGFDVLLASDGTEALALYRANSSKVSLVLLDMTMPGMTGKEVFEAIRNVRSDARVLLTSGYTEEDVTSNFAARSLSGFLPKPWLPGELLAAIKRALEN